jgi:hypothetical protein
LSAHIELPVLIRCEFYSRQLYSQAIGRGFS